MNLVEDLAAARRGKGLTQEGLAKLVGSDRQAIHRLENGIGSSDLLVRVMRALDYHMVRFANGATLPEQLANRRRSLKLTKQDVADRSGITPATVARVEAGVGSIASVIAMLDALKTKKMARRKPQYVSLTPLSWGEKDKRFTPVGFLEVLEAVWGPIDLDPCGHPESPVRARRRIMLQDGGDGLLDDWSGSFTYMNPPFSAAFKWLARADRMWREGKVKVVVALVPARTDGVYFHEHLAHACDVGFIKGRLQFSRGEGQKDIANRAPFPLMVCVWGSPSEQIEAFTGLCPTVWLQRPQQRMTQSSGQCKDNMHAEASTRHVKSVDVRPAECAKEEVA